MERAAPESTEPVGPIVGYVNDTPGPVLGPEVEGVIIAVGERALSRLDLATGAVESIELDWPVDSSWESSEVVIDGKLVAISAGDHLVTTDLTTGAQDERVELDRDDFGLGGARLIGRAGPESVWLASYDGSFDESPAAVEVDLGGTVLRRLQLGSRFYPQAALGRIVYVSGGGAMWRYDTETETSVPFAILGPPRGDQMVVVSCRPTLVCEAAVETESGLEPVPGLLSTDLGNGSLLLSPHRQQAVVSDYGSGGQPVVTHIDLVTGERTDLGRGSWIDPFMGAVWPSDGGWIVGRVSENGRRLFAIEVETFEEVLIELPDGADGFGLDPWATRLLFQPST